MPLKKASIFLYTVAMSKRQRWDMPEDVLQALEESSQLENYTDRPDYQRNDYIGWINQAKQAATRQKRISQMLDELAAGDVYMKMPWGQKSGSGISRAKPTTIEEFIQKSGPLYGDVIAKLDECLLSIQPDFMPRAAWGGWAYKIGSNYSCMIVRYKDHIKLMIWRGKMLDDKEGRLQGAGSNTQHLRFSNVDDVDRDYLSGLLSQQFELYNSGMSYED